MIDDDERVLIIGEDYFLQHFGVSGMKWGVRRSRRQQALERGAVKGGYKSSRVRAVARLGPVDIIRGRGIRGGAERKSARVGAQLERHAQGKSTALDLVKRYGSTRASDLVPVRASKANKMTTHKADIAAVAALGALYAARIILKQTSKRVING